MYNLSKNGHKKLSDYAKEELPSWSEIYHDFYLNKLHLYPENLEFDEVDPYWKIKRTKVLTALMCNQFNKMLNEDGYKEELMSFMYEAFNLEYKPLDVQFMLETNLELPNSPQCEKGELPPIYSLKNPNGTTNPFALSKRNRIFIGCDENDVTTFAIEIQVHFHKDYKKDLTTMVISRKHKDAFNEIIEFMMTPYKEYFENGVGWKDKI